MAIQTINYKEGQNQSILVIEVDDTTIEITAYKGVFGELAIDYKQLEVENGNN